MKENLWKMKKMWKKKEKMDELHNGEMMKAEGEGEKYYQGEN